MQHYFLLSSARQFFFLHQMPQHSNDVRKRVFRPNCTSKIKLSTFLLTPTPTAKKETFQGWPKWIWRIYGREIIHLKRWIFNRINYLFRAKVGRVSFQRCRMGTAPRRRRVWEFWGYPRRGLNNPIIHIYTQSMRPKINRFVPIPKYTAFHFPQPQIPPHSNTRYHDPFKHFPMFNCICPLIECTKVFWEN